MAVPTSITDLSVTPGSNFPQSTDSCGSTLAELPRNLSAIIKKQLVSGSDVTASTGILTLPSDYSSVKITGTGQTIAGFSDCFNGRIVVVRFDGVNTLTHSASFDMPTGENITTANGDVATFINVSSGVWQCVDYAKAVYAKLNANIVDASFAAGTRMVFAQASAPTGWTQDTSSNADNRMLRVVKTAGGGVGGSHSPILNNVVASHTHAFTTDTDGSHSHSVNYKNSGTSSNGSGLLRGTDSDGASPSFLSSTAHSHSGTTNINTSASNWTPRYIDMIICSKDAA